MAAAGRARAGGGGGGGGAGGGGAGGGGAVARPAGAGSLRAGWGWPGARSRPPRPPCAATSQGHVWGGTCAAAALRGRSRGWAGRGGADVGPARADAEGGRGGAGPRPGSRGGGGGCRAEKEERCWAGRALRGPRPGGLREALGPVQAAPRGHGPPRPAPPRARLRAGEAWPAAGAPPPPRVSPAGRGSPEPEECERAQECESLRRTGATRWRRSRDRAVTSRPRVRARLRRLPREPQASPRCAALRRWVDVRCLGGAREGSEDPASPRRRRFPEAVVFIAKSLPGPNKNNLLSNTEAHFQGH
ncbi:myosin heavy chain IB-like [Onychomys torridus]|uniref:myosin heavy chain IB-like n=1 Tax=Onychomys torridus TaxID=38674 RepID=UPI00167F7846|nr:myosin heavy chain IB-like [Onychomys torridus]